MRNFSKSVYQGTSVYSVVNICSQQFLPDCHQVFIFLDIQTGSLNFSYQNTNSILYINKEVNNLIICQNKKKDREREDRIDSVTQDITALSHHCNFFQKYFSLAKKMEHVITRAKAQWKYVGVQESPIHTECKLCTCMENRMHTFSTDNRSNMYIGMSINLHLEQAQVCQR